MKYKFEPLDTLAAVFSSIDDPRDNRGKLHRLIDIFILTVFGLLWGHTDFTNMALELKYHEKYFTELLGLKNGIPSHDTFSATFSVINPAEFIECFIHWLGGLARTSGKHVAIDGKAIRAACEKVYRKNVPVMVNALVVETGICIGQLRVEAKTNEIKGIPDLLSWLDLEGAVVTTDAIGCQKEIVEILRAKKAEFVLPVKDNQSALHSDIRLELETVVAGSPSVGELDTHQEFNKGHSRIERRTYHVLNNPDPVLLEGWPGVGAIGMAVRERLSIHRDENGEIIDEKPTVEVQSYIISRPMGAEEFGVYARGHWAVENSLHWVLDDALREDRCTARVGHATENLALMRKIVYNMMKMDDGVQGMSVRAKQVHYRNDPDAVCRLLFETVPGATS